MIKKRRKKKHASKHGLLQAKISGMCRTPKNLNSKCALYIFVHSQPSRRATSQIKPFLTQETPSLWRGETPRLAICKRELKDSIAAADVVGCATKQSNCWAQTGPYCWHVDMSICEHQNHQKSCCIAVHHK